MNCTPFLEKMNKLSLQKTNKEDIPKSQDLFNEPMDTDEIDLTLPLTDISSEAKKEEDKTSGDFTDIVSGAIRELKNIMNGKLAIAKAREGIAYGLRDDGNLPPFCKFQLECRPDLMNKDYSRELAELWNQKSREYKHTLLTASVNFLDQKLSTIDVEIRTKLDNTKAVIGVATKSAGMARSDLSRRFLMLKDRQEKELADFKTDIRTKQPKSSWRRTNINYRKRQVAKFRGKPYN